MYRPAKEVRIRKVQNAQGGDGEVTFYDWLLPDEAPGHGRLFSKLVIPPGASIGYHEHQGEFEAFYVLEGEGMVSDNGTPVSLHPGDMHLCPDGSAHGTINTSSDRDLVLLALILNSSVKKED